MDEDGDIWILGRTDDVLNVSGHRLSTAEVSVAWNPSALVCCCCRWRTHHPRAHRSLRLKVLLCCTHESSRQLWWAESTR